MSDFWPAYAYFVIVVLALSGLAHLAVLLIWAAGVKWMRDERSPMR